jgi:GNAT superfamily N-acetyltransferase
MIHDRPGRARHRPPANQLCAAARPPYGDAMISYQWRGDFGNAELNALHAEGFGHRLLDDDWRAQVARHSLGWACARDEAGLAGFVNVPWDGGVHAFILDTLVAARARRRGVGTRLVALAAQEAARAGCEWLHVDFEDELRPFYLDGCGFTPAAAGLIALRERPPGTHAPGAQDGPGGGGGPGGGR